MNIDTCSQYKKETDKTWQDKWNNFSDRYECTFYLSSIAACLFVISSNCENKKQEEVSKFIYEQILDLGDWLISKDVNVPLVLIVFDINWQEEWKALSGTQEWLRGQFSIQSVASKDEAMSRLEQILDEKIPDTEEVQPKSDVLLAKEIETKLSDSKVKLTDKQRKILQQIAFEIVSPNAIYRLDEWENKLSADYQQLLEGKR